MNSLMSRLLIANMISLCGTALIRVPLSEFLSQYWGVTLGYSTLLIAQLLPVVLLSPLYGSLARRFGSYFLIKYSLLVGAFSAISVLFFIQLADPYLTLFSIGVYHIIASPLKFLFPSILNLVSKDEKDAVKHFSNWGIATSFVMIFATTSGSFLQNQLSLTTIYLIDLATYFIAFALWKGPKIEKYIASVSVDPKVSISDFFSFATSSLMVSHVLRGIIWGLVNILFASTVIERFSLSTNYLGILYLIVGGSSVFGGFLAKKVKVTYYIGFLSLLIELSAAFGSLYAPDFPTYCLIVSVCSIFAPIVVVNFQTLFISRKDKTESDQRSIVFETNSNLGLFLGFVLATFFSPSSGPHTLAYVIGFFSVIVCLFFLLFSWRESKSKLHLKEPIVES